MTQTELQFSTLTADENKTVDKSGKSRAALVILST